jgi:hypothetical protein
MSVGEAGVDGWVAAVCDAGAAACALTRIFAPHLFNVEVKAFFFEPVVHHCQFRSHVLLELIPGNLNVLHISRSRAAECVGNLLHR